MFHPFLDLKKLSDEEILDKLKTANSFMNYQISMGRTITVESIKQVIEALEEERRTRLMDRQLQEASKHKTSNTEIGKLEE